MELRKPAEQQCGQTTKGGAMTTTGLTQVPSRNVCIYCLRKGILLTDEHVVPYALGGKHVLKKASCVQCADITKRFEQEVSRDLWGAARASYNAPTRRKGERPKSFSLKDPKGLASDIEVPVSEYPAFMVFYVMATAGILLGEEPTKDRSRDWQLVTIMDEARKDAFLAKHPGRLTGTFRNVPRSFGRLIAKIGYCQILTALDPEDFKPICLPYIVGKKSNISYVVGSKQPNDPPQGLGYFMRTIQVTTSTRDRMLLLAEVRLIADNDTPTYHVVVGEVLGIENVHRVSSKLDSRQPPDGDMTVSQFEPRSGNSMMVPTVWPLEY
jgi:hypothetical protein